MLQSLLFHPKVVHFPIALGVLIPLLSAGVVLAWWRGWATRRTWLMIAVLQGVLVVTSFVAIQTGQAEQERVESVVAERLIEHHENAAKQFSAGATGVLILSLLPWVLRKERTQRLVASGAWAASVLVLGLGYRTGDAGGNLVYSHGACSAYTQTGSSQSANPSEQEPEED